MTLFPIFLIYSTGLSCLSPACVHLSAILISPLSFHFLSVSPPLTLHVPTYVYVSVPPSNKPIHLFSLSLSLSLSFPLFIHLRIAPSIPLLRCTADGGGPLSPLREQKVCPLPLKLCVMEHTDLRESEREREREGEIERGRERERGGGEEQMEGNTLAPSFITVLL